MLKKLIIKKIMLLGLIFVMVIIVSGCDVELAQKSLPLKPTENTSEEVDDLDEVVLSPSKDSTEIEMFVVSDVHHLAISLREDNATFKTFTESGDGKLLKYSNQIIEALKMDIKKEKPNVLIVSGDLTINGEKATHLELKSDFEQVESDGTQVYVIPGNHDINNPLALGFTGNKRQTVDTVDENEFSQIYAQFGYDEAVSRDPNSLSYLVKISDMLYLLMMDTNKYENNMAQKAPSSDGALRGGTLEWLKTLTHMIPQTADVISVSHHNFMPHSTFLTRGFTLNNYEESAKALNALGIKVNLSGHIHTQDIQYDDENDLYDIVTGSLIQYPETYGIIKVKENHFSYGTNWVDVEGYAKKIGSKNGDLIDFKNFAKKVFSDQSAGMVTKRLEGNYTDDEKNQMAKTIGELNLRYFSGTDGLDQESITSTEGYSLWASAEESFMKSYVMSMLLDKGDDNHLEINLR